MPRHRERVIFVAALGDDGADAEMRRRATTVEQRPQPASLGVSDHGIAERDSPDQVLMPTGLGLI